MSMIDSRLPYGEGSLELPQLPVSDPVWIHAQTTPARPAHELLQKSLEAPVGSPRLCELARGKRTAAIMIPGKARRAGTAEYVTALVDELVAGGIPEAGIEVYLADGTHSQVVDEDVEFLLGSELVARVRCRGHDCHDEGILVDLGTTSTGNRVLMNRDVMQADLKVLTGRIVPHYFAGYAGGRKALIPGVAGFETIVGNHRLTIAPAGGLHPDARICNLDTNPIHLDMLEAARMVGADYCLNTILDEDQGWVQVVSGAMEAAHAEGCRLADEMLRVDVGAPLDAVITSAGGDPYDMNFMQSLKAPFNVLGAVRPGGAILWVARCGGGVRKGFQHWLSIEDDTELRAGVRDRYNLAGHNSLMLREMMRTYRVALLSDLPDGTIEGLGLTPVSSLSDGLDWLRQHAAGARWGVVPHANTLAAFATQ